MTATLLSEVFLPSPRHSTFVSPDYKTCFEMLSYILVFAIELKKCKINSESLPRRGRVEEGRA